MIRESDVAEIRDILAQRLPSSPPTLVLAMNR